MAEIKRIPTIEFEEILAKTSFNRAKLTKDYFVTILLYLVKEIEGIYFKGGTALQKIFFNHSRLSEDIDFTVTRNLPEVKKEIVKIINASGLFGKLTEDKNVEGFLRIVIGYTGFDGEKETVFIDLNQRGKLFLPSEIHKINHFYFPFIPKFSIKTLAEKELVAEKVAATVTRNKPRDHFDLYKIIKANMFVELELVKKKCSASGNEFSIIRMFNKAQTLKNRWDRDMTSLLAEPISFQEVMQFLAKHFKLKEAKERLKKKLKS